MALFRPTYTDKKTGTQKTSAIWWYEFVYAGKRVRRSAKTTRKTLAGEAEKQTRLDLERALSGVPSEKPGDRIRTVAAVIAAHVGNYSINHRPKTVISVKTSSVHLKRLLGSLLLTDLTEQRILDYMKTRLAEGASGRTINLEVGELSRALKKKWSALWPTVRKLEERKDVGKALEPEQEKAILEAAARSSSKLIYPYLVTLNWTGMRSDEAKTLRWSQVDFEAGQVIAGKAKSDAGTGRQIPMTALLKAVLEQHAAWCARKLGPIQPQWYVFPSSSRTRPVDPSRPVTSLKKAWESVRKAAGVDCRLHDLRHTFCTKLAEAGVPESTMLDIMGHVSTAMLRRYSHIRGKARRDAMDAIESRANLVGVLQESPKVTVSAASKIAVSN